ncbi:MAG TPA: hypothetical protein VNA24_33435 [Hyalangium sp.]|jgi:hypothetical protein|nr:hypothetical protein [Hyalangium sp.]
MVAPIGGGFGSGMAGLGALGGAKADGAGAAGAAGEAGGAGGEDLQKALQDLEKMLQMLMEILKNMGFAPPEAQAAPVGQAPKSGGGGQAAQAASGGGGGGGGGMDGFTPAGGGGGAGGVQGAGQTTPTGPAVNIQGIKVDPSLAPQLEAIANHPDGAKLLEAAKAQGLTEIAVNSNLNPDGGAGTEGLFLPGQGRIEIANPNSPNLIHVLAHELGHAASAGDGNSQLEEQTVDALGERIHRDLTGGASNFNLDLGSYSNLNQNNGILNTLRGLGIRV